MAAAWTSVGCPAADDALIRVGETNSSNIAMAIGADNTHAYVIVADRDTFPPPLSIRCQPNHDYVRRNLQARFPHTIANTTLVEDKKTVTHLLRHRTGEHIAFGEVMGAFCMWTPWYHIKDVPAEVLMDILLLIGELWTG